MKIKKIIFLFIFLYPSLMALGQAPGYVGKRFSIEYNINHSVLSNTEFQSLRYLTHNFTHNIWLNYATTKKTSLSVGVSHLKHDIDLDKQYTIFDEVEYGGKQMKSTTISLAVKKFRNSISPIGHHFNFFIGYSFNNYYFFPNEKDKITEQRNFKFNSPIIGIGFGKSILVGNGIYILYGVDLAYALKDYEEYSNQPKGSYLTLTNLAKVKFGVGYSFL